MTPGDGVAAPVAVARFRWLVVRVRLPDGESAPSDDAPLASRRHAVTEALIARGATGVHEDGAAFIAHYREGSVDEAELRRELAEACPEMQLETSWIDDADWARQWQSGLGSHRIGALTVLPPWLAQHANPACSVVIDPGMGFGTGEHPTTRTALGLLQAVVSPRDFVVDIGTGSAVLAIAAAKLGARRVAAIEIDADAIGNAESNVAANGVADRVRVIEGDGAELLPILTPVDVIVANIISSVLVELLPTMAEALRVGGRAILGGILVEERAQMSAVLEAGGWRLDEDAVEGIWWSTVVGRP